MIYRIFICFSLLLLTKTHIITNTANIFSLFVKRLYIRIEPSISRYHNFQKLSSAMKRQRLIIIFFLTTFNITTRPGNFMEISFILINHLNIFTLLNNLLLRFNLFQRFPNTLLRNLFFLLSNLIKGLKMFFHNIQMLTRKA